MIRIIYDEKITDREIRRLASQQKLAGDLKDKLVEELSRRGLIDPEKAKSQINVIAGSDNIVLEIGEIENDNPLINESTENEFYNTEYINDLKDFLERKAETTNIIDEIKDTTKEVIDKVMVENILSLEAS